MLHLTKEDIANTDHKRRLNIINSVTGIKPANLVGSISNEGKTNLAIFSSVVHLGSNPALIGFIMRPTGEVPRHTFENIRANKVYTINHVGESFIEKAHYTSAKIEREVSEFDRCALTEEYIEGFAAPFVKESQLKIAMKLVEEIPIEINGTILVIGEVEHILIDDHALSPEGYIDLQQLETAGISGLNSYYGLKKLNAFPYARPDEIPSF